MKVPSKQQKQLTVKTIKEILIDFNSDKDEFTSNKLHNKSDSSDYELVCHFNNTNDLYSCVAWKIVNLNM